MVTVVATVATRAAITVRRPGAREAGADTPDAGFFMGFSFG
jgi:hypothetical protein